MKHSLNLKPLVKRGLAYLIDLIVIWVVGLVISIIPILNYRTGKYAEIAEDYKREYDEYTSLILLMDESYDDSEISLEEYTEIGENMIYSSELYDKMYDDESVTKEEYSALLESINKQYEEIFNDYQYLANKNSYVSSIIMLVCQLLYFGLFQYLMKGQTVGKKIFKLKVVSLENNNVGILKLIFRSLIINDILLNAVNVVFLIFASKEIYFITNNVLSILVSFVEALVIFFVISRDDQRGLHDLMFKTKVISLSEE